MARQHNSVRCLVAIAIGAPVPLASAAESLPRLKVSENRRFLMTDEGQPFFYLGIPAARSASGFRPPD